MRLKVYHNERNTLSPSPSPSEGEGNGGRGIPRRGQESLLGFIVLLFLLVGCAGELPTPTAVVEATATATSMATEAAVEVETASPTAIATSLPNPIATEVVAAPTDAPTNTAEPTAIPGTAVTFETADGVTLNGTVYGEGATAVIFAHMGDQRQETWTEVAQRVAKRGYLALTFDFRFWQNNRMVDALRQEAPADMAAAVEFVRQQGAERVVLVGASLGGMAAIEVAAVQPVDAVAVFSSPLGPVSVGFQVDIADIAAIQAPILFVVTENDNYADDIEQMYEAANEPKAIEVYPGNRHGTELFETDLAETVMGRLLDFLEEHVELAIVNCQSAIGNCPAPVAFEFGWELARADGQIDSPTGLVVDGDGRLYVVDSTQHRIHLYDGNGQFLEYWEGGEEGAFKFSDVCCHDMGDITIDQAGNFYVLDSYHQRVLKYDAERNLLLSFGSEGEGDGQFRQPSNFGVDAAGNIYVVDEATFLVQKFNPAGEFVTAWGSEGNGEGEWAGRGWLEVDPRGFVYVVDAGNGRVLKFDLAGNLLLAWGSRGSGPGQFNTPTDVAIDSQGNVYVVEYHGHRLQKFDENGNFLGSWGSLGFSPGTVNKATAVTVDAAGNIYMGDTGNNRVQMIRQPAFSAGAAAGENIFFRGGPERTGLYDVAALRQFNSVGWQHNIQSGGIGAPVLADGVLYVSNQNGRLYALDSQTGDERWSKVLGREIVSPVAIAGGVVYLGSDRYRLYALDSQTGETLWEFQTQAEIYAAPLVLDGRAYFGSSDGTVYAVDVATQEAIWQVEIGSWLFWPLAWADGTLYAASDTGLFALDSETGTERWAMETGSFWNAPAVNNGLVYAGSDDGRFSALDAASGEVIWQFEDDDEAWSPPAVGNGLVYVGNRNQVLYALDAASGEERWRFEAADWTTTDPTLVEGVLYLGEGNHDRREGPRNLYALDAQTGVELWRFEASGRLLTAPLPGDGVVYVMTVTGIVYALE